MDGKVRVCDGRADVGGVGVAVSRGEEGEGEDVIHVDERVK